MKAFDYNEQDNNVLMLKLSLDLTIFYFVMLMMVKSTLCKDHIQNSEFLANF